MDAAFPGASVISSLQRDASIQAKKLKLKVKVSAFCLNNSVHMVDVLTVPISIPQSVTVLLKYLRFLKAPLQSDIVKKDCSSGTTGVHYSPKDVFYKGL